MDVTGKKALVIGAGTAPGRAIAVALAGAGMDIAVASATIDGEEIMAVRRTKRTVAGFGVQTAEYAFDTTLGQNVQVSTRQVAKELGGLNVLVNAQSSLVASAAERMSDSEWGRALALNLSGVFFACRSALREFGDQGGAILNVIERQTEPPSPGAAAVAAARSGVIGLTRALAAEFAGRGVRVNALEVAPGAEEQAADLALFLASSEAGLTGQLLRADRP